MNVYESSICDSLESMQIEPSENLRDRLMLSAVRGTEPKQGYRRRLPVKAVAIAAIISTLVLATAFTYGDEIVSIIKQVMFDDSTATQVVYNNNHRIGSWGVMNREDLPNARDYPIGMFDTLEEARLAAPFPLQELTYLPDNVTGLESVGVWRVEDPNNPWMHFVILNYAVHLSYGAHVYLELMQVYAGPNAYFEIENVSSIEKVVVGDAEAVLISLTDMLPQDDGTVIIKDEITGHSLSWLNDGIAFTLTASYHGGEYTPETMIRIAESVS